MNDREKFANLIFKYVVKSFNNDIDTAIKNSDDIISEVYENIRDLYECNDIPFIELYAHLNPNNRICPIDIDGVDLEKEIKIQRDKCHVYYCA